MYALVNLVHAEQSHSGSSGRGSVRNSVRLMFSRPSRVKADPFRPMRVGATPPNPFDQIFGEADPHQIARVSPGKRFVDDLEHLVHGVLFFPYR
jgi:hypothetical protein